MLLFKDWEVPAIVKWNDKSLVGSSFRWNDNSSEIVREIPAFAGIGLTNPTNPITGI